MICPQKPALKLPQGVKSVNCWIQNCLQRLLPADLGQRRHMRPR
jgi:hypothetical protein